MWVNCAGCDTCPKTSTLNIPLSLYNPKDSKTSKVLTCDQELCGEAVNLNSCKVGDTCPYRITYGDGSKSDGFFVMDTIKLNKASADDQTATMNASVAFGCAAKQEGQLGGSEGAIDGILGFGRANASVISQLASAGKVKRMFSHCLNINGGGIFAIGELVQPKVNSTAFAPNMPHYNVQTTGIDVNGKALELPTNLFGLTSGTQMVMDSGTTLAYLEDDLYKPLMRKILAAKPDLQLFTLEQTYTCFNFSGNIDNAFPTVTFRFMDSLSLTVSPHEYFFDAGDGDWCAGWQNSGVSTQNGKALNLLGDMVLGNKLVVYNIENKTIGWTDYNCSSGVKMKDEKSGTQYVVESHDLFPSSASFLHWACTSFLSMFVTFFYIYNEF